MTIRSAAHLCICVAAFAPALAHAQAVTRDPQTAIEFVKKFNAELGLSAEAVERKDKHMSSNPSRFMTAMPALFYQDVRGPFAAESRVRHSESLTGLLVGDAHLGNLMTFVGPNEEIVWGWGDCDKAGRGLLEWDLDRLAAHTVVSARLADHFSAEDEKTFVAAILAGYTKEMRAFAEGGARPRAYLELKELHGALATMVRAASSKSEKHYIKHHAPDGEFSKYPKATAAEAAAIATALVDYSKRLPADAPVANPIHLLGTGIEPPNKGGSNSGLDRYLVLVSPKDDSHLPVILRFKQMLPTALDGGAGELNHADASQVVEKITDLQGFRDPLLGYTTMYGHSILVQPRTAGREILDPTVLGAADFLELSTRAGEALARSQLQTKSLNAEHVKMWLADSDSEATAQLQHFATDYANQAAADARALKKWLRHE